MQQLFKQNAIVKTKIYVHLNRTYLKMSFYTPCPYNVGLSFMVDCKNDKTNYQTFVLVLFVYTVWFIVSNNCTLYSYIDSSPLLLSSLYLHPFYMKKNIKIN